MLIGISPGVICRSVNGGEQQPVLILECVKDASDLYQLFDILRAHRVKLLQAVWLPESIAEKSASELAKHTSPDMPGRQAKWERNCGRILELLSSTGCLVEAVCHDGRASTPPGLRHSYSAQGEPHNN